MTKMTKEELWALRKPVHQGKQKPKQAKNRRRKRRKTSKASRRRNR